MSQSQVAGDHSGPQIRRIPKFLENPDFPEHGHMSEAEPTGHDIRLRVGSSFAFVSAKDYHGIVAAIHGHMESRCRHTHIHTNTYTW